MATALDSTALVPFRPRRERMDEEQLVDIVQQEIENSIGGDWGDRANGNVLSSDLISQRRRAIDDYFGRAIGNEVEGRSQVVLTEVADTIDWMMPSLMELFTSNGEVCRFKPKRKVQKDVVDHAAALVNHILMEENDGFNLIHDFLHDGLLSKTGIMKVWYEDEPEAEREEYQGLGLEDFQLLMETPDSLELIEPTEDIEDLLPILAQGGTVDVVIMRQKPGRIMIETLAAENFGISQQARDIKEATLCYHVDLKAKSELIEMGIDAAKVDDLQPYHGGIFSEEWRARTESVEGFIGQYEAKRLDASREEVLVYENYLLVDTDDDGISEMMRILVASGGQEAWTLLDKEEVERERPFITWSPFRTPHAFYGQSVADKMHDIQVIKSTLARLGLDNANNVNINRIVADPTAVNMDDLGTNNLAGIVKLSPRASARGITPQNAVHPITSVPILDQVMPMLDYFDNVRRGRMGVDPNSQDTTVENLSNQTSGVAISLIQDSARKKQQMIARHAANALEAVCQRILTLAIRHRMIAEVEVDEGEFIRIDPGDWQDDMIAAVDVGLGFGSKERETAAIAGLASLQSQAVAMQGGTLDGPLVRPSHIAETMTAFISASQLGRAGDFVADPTMLREMEEQQDASAEPSEQEQMEMQAAQLELQKIQLEVQKNGAMVLKARADAEKARTEAAVAAQQPMLDARRDQVNMIREMRGAKLDEAKIAGELRMKMLDSEKSGKMAELKLIAEDNQKRRDRLVRLREIESREAIERMKAGLQREQSAEQRAYEAEQGEVDREHQDRQADKARAATVAPARKAGGDSGADTNKIRADLEAVQTKALKAVQGEVEKAMAALEAEKQAVAKARASAGKTGAKQKTRQSQKRTISFVRGEDGRIAGAELS